jgi:hypothetical protein
MPRGGSRPGAGRTKVLNDMGLPPRKRGRPSKADLALRAAAEAEYHARLAEQAEAQATGVDSPAAPPPPPIEAPSLLTKPVPYTPPMPEDVQPLDYFLRIMRDPRVPPERRDRAAQFALNFTATKPGEAKKGKKEDRADRAAAHSAEGSPFAPRRPRLAAAGGQVTPEE